MLIGHVLPLSCYRKKLQNLSNLDCGLQIRQIWIHLITVCEDLQKKVYKMRVADLDELKQRLRSENRVGQLGLKLGYVITAEAIRQ